MKKVVYILCLLMLASPTSIFAQTLLAAKANVRPGAMQTTNQAPIVKWFIRSPQRVEGSEVRCGSQAESCSECGTGWSRVVWRVKAGSRTYYRRLCCPPPSRAIKGRIYSGSSFLGYYGACLVCPPGARMIPPRTENGRKVGFDCAACPGGWKWQTYRGATVCLKCSSGLVYDPGAQKCVRRYIKPNRRVP